MSLGGDAVHIYRYVGLELETWGNFRAKLQGFGTLSHPTNSTFSPPKFHPHWPFRLQRPLENTHGCCSGWQHGHWKFLVICWSRRSPPILPASTRVWLKKIYSHDIGTCKTWAPRHIARQNFFIHCTVAGMDKTKSMLKSGRRRILQPDISRRTVRGCSVVNSDTISAAVTLERILTWVELVWGQKRVLKSKFKMWNGSRNGPD